MSCTIASQAEELDLEAMLHATLSSSGVYVQSIERPFRCNPLQAELERSKFEMELLGEKHDFKRLGYAQACLIMSRLQLEILHCARAVPGVPVPGLLLLAGRTA
jgi:hypothetical protein